MNRTLLLSAIDDPVFTILHSCGLQSPDITTGEGFRDGKGNILLACKGLYRRIVRIDFLLSQ